MRSSFYLIVLLIILAPLTGGAQSYLAKGVSVKAQQKKLEEVLNIIGKQGGFYFSYNSDIVPGDSLIDIDVWNKTVRQTLDIIFKGRFEYKETQSHVIIQLPSGGQVWYVSGYVADALTGERLRDVSVFEPGQLAVALTNESGFFRLKLKDRTATVITVSKAMFKDTTVRIKPGVDQEVQAWVTPKNYELDPVIVSSRDNVEGTWFGKMFLSSGLKMQSQNLSRFFVNMPVQASVTPGLSSQGRMSTQVVNKFSFNMIGGYTAGVRGAEIGGIFNMNKKDVSYLQVGGVINIVGGSVGGIQLAGVHNNVLTSVDGAQAAGVSNMVRGDIEGAQLAGAYNHAGGKVDGVQAAGAVNYGNDTIVGAQLSGAANIARRSVEGVQVAGGINYAKEVDGAQISGGVNMALGTVDGAQISGGFNFAKKLDGVQIGLVNYADSSTGMAIGLFSFVRFGYHKVSLCANEAFPYNVSLKTGTKRLYNIYTVGAAFNGTDKAFVMGLGYGSELSISRKFSFTPELIGNMVYLGNWGEANPLLRFNMQANYRINKWIAIFAGPTFNAYWNNNIPKVDGYMVNILPQGYKANAYNANLSSWVGWSAGIAFF